MSTATSDMVTALILLNDVLAFVALPTSINCLPELIVVLQELHLEVLAFAWVLGVHAVGAVYGLTVHTDGGLRCRVYHSLTVFLSAQLELGVLTHLLKLLLLLMLSLEFNCKRFISRAVLVQRLQASLRRTQNLFVGINFVSQVA